jgi:hypothetical protein
VRSVSEDYNISAPAAQIVNATVTFIDENKIELFDEYGQIICHLFGRESAVLILEVELSIAKFA